MKAIEKILKKTVFGPWPRVTVGNHSAKNDGGIIRCYYHWTEICTIYKQDGKFETNDGGYKTSSTSRAINDYTRRLLDAGYKLIA